MPKPRPDPKDPQSHWDVIHTGRLPGPEKSMDKNGMYVRRESLPFSCCSYQVFVSKLRKTRNMCWSAHSFDFLGNKLCKTGIISFWNA